ncbi:MAG TPA: serine/threonine-protein kinase [Polyangia bacterium]|nr:serine/threonine-protein kinase [Polyangia bacterium]
MAERVVSRPETFVPDAAGQRDAGSPPRRSPVTPAGEHYEHLGEIGRGGMGTVYSVRDLRLLRISAMKVMASRLAERRHEVDRFLCEARITAQLDHPNIVPVHEIGTDANGSPYFTMKRVEGRTLSDWIGDLGPLHRDPEQFRLVLDAYLKVCDAVAFAHSRGVIHCDIKPSNVMVGSFGQVYLMDWGLAQVLSENAANSEGHPQGVAGPAARRSGRPAGTPSFMSPEQATCAPLDERTDVFGLGALLYAVLTGRPPFPGADNESALSQARAGVVAPPTAADMPLPKGLFETSLRAMAHEKSERQRDVGALKREVEDAIRALPFVPTKVYAPGSRIVSEGEPGDCAFVVVSGSCVAYKADETGGRLVLRHLDAGSVFGETAVLSGGVRTATVEAQDEVVVNVVSRQVLEQNLGLATPFGAFVTALADRFRELDGRANPATIQPVSASRRR